MYNIQSNNNFCFEIKPIDYIYENIVSVSLFLKNKKLSFRSEKISVAFLFTVLDVEW